MGQVPQYPITRIEQYLDAILGSLESGAGGGTNDYERLQNKPSINGVELIGDVALSDIMSDVTQEDVEEALPEADIEQIVTDAWNAAFEEGGG